MSVLFFERQGDTLSLPVDIEDTHLNLLADLDNLGRISDESICQLADMDQAILMYPDIGEGPEFGDIGDDRRQQHAGTQVGKVMNSLGKLELDKGLSGIATGSGQFADDILQGRQAD